MRQYTRPLLHGAFVLLVIGAGVALRSRVLDGTLLADDYDHYAMQRGIYPVARGPLDTYDFVADAQERAVLMARGRLPWWTDPKLQLSVLRPLSSALTWADYAWFDTDSRAHHIHSIAWWALLVGATALLFRALLPTATALVATALYALEEGHNLPLAWAANRNEIVALSLGMLALWAYVRERQGTFAAGRWLAPLLLVLAFAGGEHALPVVAYFAAYEAWLAQGPLRERARRLLPIALIALGYLGLRAALGHGIAGSGFYVSPFGTPLRFARELGLRLPLLLADLVLGAGAEWFLTGIPFDVHTLTLGLVEGGAMPLSQWQRIHLVLAGVASSALLFALVSRRALERLGAAAGGERAARFFLLATLLSLVPAASALPMSRLTLCGAVGIDAVLASLLIGAGTALARAAPAGKLAALAVLLPILLVHGGHAGFRARAETSYYAMLSLLNTDWARRAELDDARVSEQRVLIVGARDWLSHYVVPYVRHALGLHMPAATYLLSAAADNPHVLTRVSPEVLELRVLGHPLPGSVLGGVYRPANHPLHPGDLVMLPGILVTVLETEGGQPIRTRFTFAAPLDPAHDVLLYSREDGMRQVALPAVGTSVRLPAPALPRPLPPQR